MVYFFKQPSHFAIDSFNYLKHIIYLVTKIMQIQPKSSNTNTRKNISMEIYLCVMARPEEDLRLYCLAVFNDDSPGLVWSSLVLCRGSRQIYNLLRYYPEAEKSLTNFEQLSLSYGLSTMDDE